MPQLLSPLQHPGPKRGQPTSQPGRTLVSKEYNKEYPVRAPLPSTQTAAHKGLQTPASRALPPPPPEAKNPDTFAKNSCCSHPHQLLLHSLLYSLRHYSLLRVRAFAPLFAASPASLPAMSCLSCPACPALPCLPPTFLIIFKHVCKTL